MLQRLIDGYFIVIYARGAQRLQIAIDARRANYYYVVSGRTRFVGSVSLYEFHEDYNNLAFFSSRIHFSSIKMSSLFVFDFPQLPFQCVLSRRAVDEVKVSVSRDLIDFLLGSRCLLLRFLSLVY